MTFKVTFRGTPSRTTIADYHCPVHGRFEISVERTAEGDAPDTVFCPVTPECYREIDPAEYYVPTCAETATWCISAPLARVNPIEAVKGKWTKPERPTYTDTRNLGEGQPLYEWKEDRAKVWEDRRKADVMRFAKEG